MLELNGEISFKVYNTIVHHYNPQPESRKKLDQYERFLEVYSEIDNPQIAAQFGFAIPKVISTLHKEDTQVVGEKLNSLISETINTDIAVARIIEFSANQRQIKGLNKVDYQKD